MGQRGNQQNGIRDRPASAKEWGQRMGSELQARFPVARCKLVPFAWSF